MYLLLEKVIKVRLHENAMISNLLQLSFMSLPFAFFFQKELSYSSGSNSGRN